MKILGVPLPIHTKLVRAKLVLMGLTRSDLETLKPNLYEKAVISAQKEYLALLTLSGANSPRFSGLKDKLDNESLFGHDNCPKNQVLVSGL